ncbi:conserved hypothetical protein [Ricinus communis]|uniref:Uncharacterized protein n=1 Tax=Ricinus communis TaxID=3988 RepID=B9RG17_RICCO|nr:conserved hypothetical protein [Ricinus communis]
MKSRAGSILKMKSKAIVSSRSSSVVVVLSIVVMLVAWPSSSSRMGAVQVQGQEDVGAIGDCVEHCGDVMTSCMDGCSSSNLGDFQEATCLTACQQNSVQCFSSCTGIQIPLIIN